VRSPLTPALLGEPGERDAGVVTRARSRVPRPVPRRCPPRPSPSTPELCRRRSRAPTTGSLADARRRPRSRGRAAGSDLPSHRPVPATAGAAPVPAGLRRRRRSSAARGAAAAPAPPPGAPPHPPRPPPLTESVWDYPRPPRVEPSDRLVTVVLGGVEVCRTSRAWRVLETSHPPGGTSRVRTGCPARSSRRTARRTASSRASRATST
jgi:hypothetical protein